MTKLIVSSRNFADAPKIPFAVGSVRNLNPTVIEDLNDMNPRATFSHIKLFSCFFTVCSPFHFIHSTANYFRNVLPSKASTLKF